MRKKLTTTISSPFASTRVNAALMALRQPSVRMAAENGQRCSKAKRPKTQTESTIRRTRRGPIAILVTDNDGAALPEAPDTAGRVGSRADLDQRLRAILPGRADGITERVRHVPVGRVSQSSSGTLA